MFSSVPASAGGDESWVVVDEMKTTGGPAMVLAMRDRPRADSFLFISFLLFCFISSCIPFCPFLSLLLCCFR